MTSKDPKRSGLYAEIETTFKTLATVESLTGWPGHKAAMGPALDEVADLLALMSDDAMGHDSTVDLADRILLAQLRPVLAYMRWANDTYQGKDELPLMRRRLDDFASLEAELVASLPPRDIPKAPLDRVTVPLDLLAELLAGAELLQRCIDELMPAARHVAGLNVMLLNQAPMKARKAVQALRDHLAGDE